MAATITPPDRTVYPESDGKPMADYTLQFEWILTLFQWLDLLYRGRPDVLVAGNLFWYPVQGDPTTVVAPDVFIAFGRPKGHRPSYKQWLEGGLPPQVTFEVQSPSNSSKDLAQTREFYHRYGVEEYYLYDPDRERFQAWRRQGPDLLEVPTTGGIDSPRLGVRLECPVGGPLRAVGPDGRPLRTAAELADAADALAAKLRALGVDPDAV
jgi:Uma2 family endonuclease